MVYSWGCGLIELPDGSWGSLYAGSSWLHNAGRPEGAPPAELRWATWRPHRLCGVEAAVEGRCTIPTVYRTRDELRLNYRCRPGGWVSVELLHAVPSRIHADVEPVAGFTFTDCGRLTGDAEDALVTWNGRSDISPGRRDGRHPAAPVPGHGVRVFGLIEHGIVRVVCWPMREHVPAMLNAGTATLCAMFRGLLHMDDHLRRSAKLPPESD